ncbi:MAG: hypothetical protein JST21_16825 [Bacteroidetes bacterium]|nr:hypothetical protein [Bacteroidota bacterium]
MKKVLSGILFFLFGSYVSFACPVCERNQPAILKGITHGSGPDSQWDYLIVAIAVVIVLYTLFYSVKWLVRPGEKSESHIKRMILNN